MEEKKENIGIPSRPEDGTGQDGQTKKSRSGRRNRWRRNRHRRDWNREAARPQETVAEEPEEEEAAAEPDTAEEEPILEAEPEEEREPEELPAEELPAEPAEEKVPVEIVGVCFKEKGKVYYFDPKGEKYQDGDRVIVETARGIEYAFISGENRIIHAGQLFAPLKPVIRRATESDTVHYEENLKKAKDALAVCEKKIAAHELEMKLVDAEYAFDNSKLLFYFTADGRVDFRELVKDLASVFRTRIELRQIGIRDEAKMIGGIGVCGRPFCCHAFLPDFVQVSIKMAKEQNFSINSAKMTGNCGRLMCCLHFEYETYLEEIAKTPKVDTVVKTPDGDGVVTEVIPLSGLVRVKLQNTVSNTARLYHRDKVTPIGKMNWKTGVITPFAPPEEEKPVQSGEATPK
ncbi:MAG: stage 0 sporulation family protein [Clostridia bacterium]|nr:stage 0 sporulation family protein [Clostridia bacterium]